MKQNIFRKVAMDRLSSPEELDKMLTVTSPRAWLSLIGIGLVLGTALIWGIFGNIATRIDGQGILLSKGGVYSIVHVTGGLVTDVRIKPGDQVKKGDVLVRIDQSEAATTLNMMKETLVYLENLDVKNPQLPDKNIDVQTGAEVLALVSEVREALAGVEQAQADAEQELAEARLQLEKARLAENNLREKVSNYEKLYELGGVSREELEQVQNDLPLQEMERGILEKKVQELLADTGQVLDNGEQGQTWTNLASLQQQLADKRKFVITELQAQIAEGQRAIEDGDNIVSSIDGRVLEVNYKKGDLLQAGASVASIVREIEGDKSLQAIIYVSAEQGKKILPGMEADISPTIIQKEEYGYLLGKVVSVSEYPVSTQSMLMRVGNQDLVSQLSGQGAPVEVQVELIVNDKTVSGYSWSTPEGPEVNMESGTICIGSVTVGKKRPITMVLPYIKKLLPM
ncbi:MAG: NHLP bacteriocin system secretion protein [Eubacteriales bacterium]